ncbi:MAG: class I SAM-dependent methyltransferase [Alphaproteobacteria bacterium]
MTATYTNAAHDRRPGVDARTADEGAVRALYERSPYPDLGADLKDLSLYLDPIRDALARRGQVRFLDAGCGTGHILVGVASRHPDWTCCGIDLSQASLDVAGQLATRHGATVTLHRGSYLDPLPFGARFDVISAMGTIHHAADPVAAMRAMRANLADDGFLLLHLYGWRADREKFDLKEALSLLEPDLFAHEERFALYDALMRHRRGNWLRRLALTRPVDVYAALRDGWRNLRRRSRRVSWSPPFTARFDAPTSPWIDHFCHPCERAYEVPQVRALLEETGFEVLHMLRQGRDHAGLVPSAWRAQYDKLDRWDRWRLSELLADGGGSFAIVARPAGKA